MQRERGGRRRFPARQEGAAVLTVDLVELELVDRVSENPEHVPVLPDRLRGQVGGAQEGVDRVADRTHAADHERSPVP